MESQKRIEAKTIIHTMGKGFTVSKLQSEVRYEEYNYIEKRVLSDKLKGRVKIDWLTKSYTIINGIKYWNLFKVHNLSYRHMNLRVEIQLPDSTTVVHLFALNDDECIDLPTHCDVTPVSITLEIEVLSTFSDSTIVEAFTVNFLNK